MSVFGNSEARVGCAAGFRECARSRPRGIQPSPDLSEQTIVRCHAKVNKVVADNIHRYSACISCHENKKKKPAPIQWDRPRKNSRLESDLRFCLLRPQLSAL